MTAEQIAAPPSWSLAAAGSARTAPPPGFRTGRPEEAQEYQRFAAAMQRADARSTQAEERDSQPIRLASRPEDRQANQAVTPVDGSQFFGEDGFGFDDVVDMINPLQHLPVISTAYREMTGDTISPGARLAGGALFGGPLGFASAVADTVAEDLGGRDVGGSMLAAMTGSPTPDDAAVLADATDPAEAAAAIAPAAGSQPVQQAAMPAAMAAVLPAATKASPLMAAQPVGSPFAAMPQGSPMMVNTPAGTPSALQAAGEGVPNLSPAAAETLMRLSQQPLAPAAAKPAISAPPSAPMTKPARPPVAKPEPVSEPPSTASARSADPSPTQTAELIEPMPVENLPEAMMQALSKYEALKRSQ